MSLQTIKRASEQKETLKKGQLVLLEVEGLTYLGTIEEFHKHIKNLITKVKVVFEDGKITIFETVDIIIEVLHIVNKPSSFLQWIKSIFKRKRKI